MSLHILTISKNTYKSIDDEYPYERDLETINKLLQREGVQQYDDTPQEQVLVNRAACSSFPSIIYSILCRLVAYGYAKLPQLPPLQDGNVIDEDEVLVEEMNMLRSHIICHSDSEGYFVPVNFNEPIMDDDIWGGALCSSIKVMEELINCAYLIGINVEDNAISDKEAENINLTLKDHPFFAERIAWFAMYEAARISVKNNVLVVLL